MCWHVTVSSPDWWHVTTNIHPWFVTCDNIHPWDRLSFRVPARAAWPGGKRPSLGLFLSSARLKICPATGHWLSPRRAAAPPPAETAGTLWLYLCDVVMGWIMSLRRVSSFTRLSLSWLSCFYPAVSNGNIYARMLGGNNKFSWLPWQQLSIFRCQAIWRWMYV